MKFIYIADTHIGGNDETGYRQQSRYLCHFQELIDCLREYIEKISDINFIIHGGDMVDNTTPENITASAKFFGQLPCPTYLALGNHDLTTQNSIALWMQYAPQFFIGDKPDFRLIHSGVQFDFILCNWGKIPALWNSEEPQVPWLSASQLAQIPTLDKACFTQLVITHSPMYGVPSEQHGGTAIMHAPTGDFTEKLSEHLNHTSLVLGAHNHINMSLMKATCHYATVAAFSETPFEFKLIEITPGKMSMQTLQLKGQVSFLTEYNAESAYVQGRQCDREFEQKFIFNTQKNKLLSKSESKYLKLAQKV